MRYTCTTSPTRLNTLSETKYNMRMEWASFVLNSFAQPKASLFIEPLIPPAALEAFISAPGQSK